MPGEYADLVAAAGTSTPPVAPAPAVAPVVPLADGAAPAPSPAPVGEYHDLVQQFGSANELALRSAAHVAVQTDADKHAELVALADLHRVPTQVVADNLDLYKARARFSAMDLDRVKRDHPELADWLSNPDNASLAQDDVPALRLLDHAMRSITDPKADPTGILPSGFLFGRDGQIHEPLPGGLGATYASLDDLRSELDRRDDRQAVEQIDRQTLIDQRARGYAADGFATQVGAGVLGSATGGLTLNALRLLGLQGQGEEDALQALQQGAAQQIPGIGGGIVRGGIGMVHDLPAMFLGAPLAKLVPGVGRLALALKTAAALAPVNIANDLIEGTRLHGFGYGATSFLIDSAIPAAVPLFGGRVVGVAAKLVGATEQTAATAADGWTAAARRWLVEHVGGQASLAATQDVAHAMQDVAFGVDPHALDADKLSERLFVSSVLGAAQGGFFGAIPAVGDKLHRDAVAADAATGYRDRLGVVVDALKASQTQERSPDRMRLLMETLGGPDRQTYAQAGDWDAHWTALGQDPLVAARAMGAEKSYLEAKATGGDMAIPVEAFAQAAAHEQGAKLMDLARSEPGAKSADEAKAFKSTAPDQIEALRKEVAAAADLPAVDPTEATVRDDLVHQLVGAGTDATAAKRQAQIVARAYRTMAARASAGQPEGAPRLTAADLFDRFPMSVSMVERAPQGRAYLDEILDRIRTGDVPTVRDVGGQSLIDFLRTTGLQDQGTELSTLGVDEVRKPGQKALIQAEGLTLDEAAARAAEAGFIPERSINGLLAAISAEVHGQPVFRQGDANPRHEQTASDVAEVQAALKAKGINLTTATNEEAKRALLAGEEQLGQTVLAQSGADAPRAQIAFGKDRRFAISLFEHKNLSSYLHESGHAFLEVMSALASEATAPEQIRADMTKIREWLGAKDGEAFTTPQHEQFARGFEAYLMEGKAPAGDLRETFARVRQWFVDLYKKVSGLGANLTDEVRGVFDRLIATDDEIAAAEHEGSVEPLFATAKDAGMTPERFAAYKESIQQAHNEAVSDLAHRLILEQRAADSEAYRLAKAEAEKATTAEVDARPAFAALNALQDGRLPGGEQGPAVKLDRADLVARYGETGLKQLPGPGKSKANRGRHVYTPEGGIGLDHAAELFGFKSGDELYRALVSAPNREQVIAAETKTRLREQFPDSRTNGSAMEKAADAVQNEHRGDVIHAELLALRKRQREAAPIEREAARVAAEAERQRGAAKLADAQQHADAVLTVEKAAAKAKADQLRADQRDLAAQRQGIIDDARASVPPVQLLRATARETIRGKVVRDLNPNGYLVAARVASRETIAHAAKGDWIKAADAKQRELLSHELYRAAMDASERLDTGHAYLRNIQGAKARERIGKAGGWEYTVVDSQGKRGQVFATEAEAQASADKIPGAAAIRTQGHLEQIDGILDRFDLRPRSAAELTRRESLPEWIAARELEAAQVAIPAFLRDETLRRNWKQLTVDQANGVVDAVKNIEAMARTKNKLTREAAAKTLEEAVARTVGTITENSRGPRKQKIGRSFVDRIGEFFGMCTASLRKMASVVREMDGFKDGGFLHELLVRPLNDAADAESVMHRENAVAYNDLAKAWGKYGPRAAVRHFEPAIGASISLEGKIAAALNWGNAGNRIRLMKGTGWSVDQVHALLDTLDAKDWQFVQGVLDHVNSYWPRIAAKQQRVTGVAPEKVEAIPIETRHGTFRGGYYPVSYDSRKSPRAEARMVEDQARLAIQGGYTAATTRRGHTEARNEEGTGDQVRLDLGVIHEHLSRVVHDLAYHEALIDLSKVLRQKEVVEAITSHHGIETYKQMQATLTDAAAGQVFAQDGLEKSLNYLRAGTTTAAMAWNLQVAAMNASGITQSMVRVGPVYMAKAMAKIGREAAGLKNAATWIDEVSPYMRERTRLSLKSAEDVHKHLNPTGPLEPVRATFHFFTAKMDRAVGIPSWLGAYMKAMDGGAGHDDAVAQADQTVRDTQGAGGAVDLASVQRGHPLKKLFTAFYHYMSTTYNLTAEGVNRTRSNLEAPTSVGAVGRDAATIARLGSDLLLLYALPAAIAVAVRAMFHPKDDRDIPEEFGAEVGGMALGTVPLARDLASTIFRGTGYKGPTGTRGLEQIGELIQQVRGEFQHPERDHRIGHTAANVLGVILHLPSVQVSRTIDGLIYASENGGNPLPLFAGGPPPKH